MEHVAYDRADNKIQVGNNNKPKSSKFIIFSLLIYKLSCFK